MDRPVLQLCYSSVLFGKQRKIHPRRRLTQKKWREEKRKLISGSSFYMFPHPHPPPPGLPYVNWASQGGLFASPEVLSHSGPLTFLCSIFVHFSLLCLLASTILDSFSCSNYLVQFSSVQFSRLIVSDSLRPHEWQHARPPCPSPTPGVLPDSRPLSQTHLYFIYLYGFSQSQIRMETPCAQGSYFILYSAVSPTAKIALDRKKMELSFYN